MNHRGDRIFSVSELRLHGSLEATILYAAAADGTLIPPFVIFRGKINSWRYVRTRMFPLDLVLLFYITP